MSGFVLDGITFLQQMAEQGVSKDGEFILVKSDDLLRFYEELRVNPPRTIMEIGSYEGGSTVYFDRLYRPERIVGLDARATPVEPLERYREAHPHVRTYYGHPQDQPGTLTAARENFPTGIDLVIDDASHQYAATRATFAMLFPLVRLGGLYVIEDWSWSHAPQLQGPDAGWADQPALTNFVFELILLAATSDAVDSVRVENTFVCVRRGPGAFRPEMLDFSTALRGKSLPRL